MLGDSMMLLLANQSWAIDRTKMHSGLGFVVGMPAQPLSVYYTRC